MSIRMIYKHVMKKVERVQIKMGREGREESGIRLYVAYS